MQDFKFILIVAVCVLVLAGLYIGYTFLLEKLFPAPSIDESTQRIGFYGSELHSRFVEHLKSHSIQFSDETIQMPPARSHLAVLVYYQISLAPADAQAVLSWLEQVADVEATPTAWMVKNKSV